MKNTFFIIALILCFCACHEKPDNSAQLKFEENSKTVMAMLKAWETETPDYSVFADDVVIRETGFGAEKDSFGLEEMKEQNKRSLAALDFKLLGDPVMLPGVNPDTKMPDGSVRYYGDWEVTRTATDSTEAKSGVLRVYHSFDFNDDGKIVYEQMYADFTGLMNHLWGPRPVMADDAGEAVEEATEESE